MIIHKSKNHLKGVPSPNRADYPDIVVCGSSLTHVLPFVPNIALLDRYNYFAHSQIYMHVLALHCIVRNICNKVTLLCNSVKTADAKSYLRIAVGWNLPNIQRAGRFFATMSQLSSIHSYSRLVRKIYYPQTHPYYQSSYYQHHNHPHNICSGPVRLSRQGVLRPGRVEAPQLPHGKLW